MGSFYNRLFFATFLFRGSFCGFLFSCHLNHLLFFFKINIRLVCLAKFLQEAIFINKDLIVHALSIRS